jgi:hypothetical protein
MKRGRPATVEQGREGRTMTSARARTLASASAVIVLSALLGAWPGTAAAQSDGATCAIVPLSAVQQQFGSGVTLGAGDAAFCSFLVPTSGGSGPPIELAVTLNSQSAGNLELIKKGCTPKVTADTYKVKVDVATLVKGVGTVACYQAFTQSGRAEYDFSAAAKSGAGANVLKMSMRAPVADLHGLVSAKKAQAKLTAIGKAAAALR